jgi:phage baseplate assembly protein W|tara:strand:+ start:9 stop:431 length:423 start_codon:yes stop_codon:yes gene_type:complete
MAIKQTNIFPIDEQPRNAVGVAYPFSSFAVSGSSPFKLNYTTQDQIKSNLTLFFTTNQNERPLNPNYGGGLKDILFEQLQTETFEIVEKRIKDNLSIYFPEVKLKNLEVLEDIDNNTLKVIMSYVVFNNNEDSLEINFNV